MSEDREAMRQALRRIATNVAVITTKDRDALHGMTANVWSEGTEPPIVLVTLNRKSETYARVKSSGVFAVSVLGETQKEIALRFAGRGSKSEIFDDVECRFEDTGSPILEGCVAFFDCRVEGFYPFGNYDIVTGKAQAYGYNASEEPLVFYGGDFGRFVSLTAGETVASTVEEQK